MLQGYACLSSSVKVETNPPRNIPKFVCLFVTLNFEDRGGKSMACAYEVNIQFVYFESL